MIHALPGMGADHRMFPEPWSRLPGFKAHDWAMSPEIRSVRELAEVMIETCAIADGDVLVGVSLGGIVAGEITKLRKISQLFLVSSAVAPGEVNPWLAKLPGLVEQRPMEWLRQAAGMIPGELAAMFAQAEPAFIRNMCRAIFEWDGLGEMGTPVFRIHGRTDLLIPAPPEPDLLLGGGHLIAMTHAAECAAFVARHLYSPSS
jgi:pimeloyl-ACP methyl ester carboxylesterase